MMRVLIVIFLGLFFSGSAWAQSAPAPLNELGTPTPITKNGVWTAEMWTAAFQSYVSTKGGAAQQLSLTGAKLDGTSMIVDQTASAVVTAIKAINTAMGVPANNLSTIRPEYGAVTRSQQERNQDTVSLLDFCSVMNVNGATDNTTCYQNAVYAVCAGVANAAPFRSGGELYVPAGAVVLSQVKIPCNGVHIHNAGNGNVNSGNLDYRGTVYVSTPGNTGTMFKYTSASADYGTGFTFDHAGIDASNMAAGGTLFDISWTQHSTIRDVSILNPYNIFKEEGGAANLVEDMVVLGLRGTGFEFWGDASNCGTNNPSVSLASCNKRADLLRLSRVNMNGAAGHVARCVYWHDFSQSLQLSNTICESAAIGLQIDCAKSQGNNGEACPAFGRFYDPEFEDCTLCMKISDAQDLEGHGGYMLGQGTASINVVQVVNTNFGAPASASAKGSYAEAFRWIGGRFGNSGGSIMSIGVSEFILTGGHYFSASLSATGAASALPAIDVTGVGSTVTPVRGIISDNILCVASGQQPLSIYQGGIRLGSGVGHVHVHDNETSSCLTSVLDQSVASGGTSTNSLHDNG